MKREDVPQHIRDRVAQANGRGRAQIGNNAGWRSLSEIRALMATMFGNTTGPKRAAEPKPRLTRTTDLEMGRTVRTGPDPDEQLYRRAWGNPKH